MTQIEPGIYKDLSNEDYHKDTAISRSGIMLFNDSPYRYWANYLNPGRPPKHSTPEMEFGSAFHEYVLEPALFEEHYEIAPEKVLLKNVGRESFDSYNARLAAIEKSSKKIISYENAVKLKDMMRALRGNHQAWQLIQGATYESSYFWKDKASELMVSTRPDILHKNMIIDLKTIKGASYREYQRGMVDGSYHIQGAMFQDGVYNLTGNFIETVINICIEKTYPYAVGIKIISEEALEKGRSSYKEALVRMKECFENEQWPSYEVETVDLPPWSN